MEIFVDIKGYETLYQVSNFGRIKSLGNGKSNASKLKILKQHITKDGYSTVALTINSVTQRYRVHKLVANAFIPNPNNYPCINHKDENKQNNTVDNLEWCTSKYNNNYGTRIERFVESMKGKLVNRKDTSKKIMMCSLKNELIEIFPSMMEVTRKYGFSVGAINQCAKGITKQSYGYKWKFL
ncbi:NUMOD4 domain-containing protein [Bacteroides fragilis]|nr:NUMOD4 domain-containing protein [Bacteroides fragilis]